MKNDDKPHSMEDLSVLMADRNYHKELLIEAEVIRKSMEGRLKQAVEEETRHYNRLQEIEAKILRMVGNLK